MKILVQSSKTLKWLRRMDVWTDNVQEAFDFQHSQRALDFIYRHKLTFVQLVVSFPDPNSDVTVRLPFTEREREPEAELAEAAA
jgi:hypothetical protein